MHAAVVEEFGMPLAAVGSGVTIVKEGDRVGVPWIYSACGHCEYFDRLQHGDVASRVVLEFPAA